MTLSKFSLKIAQPKNIAWIMHSIDLCRPILAAQQSDQWQGKEPSLMTIRLDVQHHRYHLFLKDHTVIGGAALLSKDDAYDHLLSGSWLNQEPYIVIHRFFIHPEFQGKKLGKLFLSAIETKVWNQGIRNVRVDTHEKNLPMRGLLTSLGFLEVGRVNLPLAGERLVYHKVRGK
jgi:GNAT superfamily N-acetyltransferase